MHNNVPHDSERGAKKKDKGNVYLGSLDFTFNRFNWIARGNIDYGYVSNANEIQVGIPQHTHTRGAPRIGQRKELGSYAWQWCSNLATISFTIRQAARRQPTSLPLRTHWTLRLLHTWRNQEVDQQDHFAAGINYYPIPQIAIKAEYNYRNLEERIQRRASHQHRNSIRRLLPIIRETHVCNSVKIPFVEK